MCSRFHLSSPPETLIARFGLRVPPPYPNADMIRPTDLALAIGPRRSGRLVRWGLPVARESRPIINARLETAEVKPTFRRLLRRRVLVPADAYVEWRTDAAGGKHLNRITRPDGAAFACAGLLDEAGHFTLLTCAPAADVAHVHDRMPVILTDPTAEEAWLSPAAFAEIRPLLGPYPQPLRVEEEQPPPPAQPSLL